MSDVKRPRSLRHGIPDDIQSEDTTQRSACTVAGLVVLACTAGQSTGANAQDTITIPTITVKSSVTDIGDPDAYKIDNLTNNKFNQSILNTPRSVQVVPQSMIKDQSATNFNDVLRNVPGITLQAGEGNPPGGNQLKIRGFSASGNLYVDGMRDPGFQFRDTFNTQGVEVIKGPSSTEFGQGTTGGVVNFVSKKPTGENFISGEASVGDGVDAEDPVKRLSIDVNQQIKGVDAAVRIAALAHDGGVAGRDKVEQERLGFAPSVTFGLNAPTSATLSYQYYSLNGLPDAGIPLVRNVGLSGLTGKPAPVNYSYWYGYLNRDYMDYDHHSVSGSLEHEFSDRFKVETRARYSHLSNDSITSSPRVVTAGGVVTGIRGDSKPRDQVDNYFVSQTDGTAKIKMLGAQHTIVGGFEYSHEQAENKRRLDTQGALLTTAANPFGAPNNSIIASQQGYNGTSARIQSDTLAVHLNDSIEIGEQWIVNGGVRFDHIETSVRGEDPNNVGYGQNLVNGKAAISGDRTDNEISWNGGVVFKPGRSSSVYASYGTSFEPVGSLGAAEGGNFQLGGGNNNGPVETGFYFDPQRNETFEIGTKWDVLDDKLNVSAAIFRINQENVRVVSSTPGDPASVDGKQRVEGIELTATGNLTSAWSVFGGYTYLDSEILEGDSRRVGSRVDNIPEHSASIWTSYELPIGLRLSGGATYVGERTTFGSPDDTTGNQPVAVEDYIRFDASASMPILDNVDVNFNLRNIGNVSYIESVQSGGGQGVPGEAFSALLTVQARF